ncbi:hypothetical protein SSX86_009150 [Deinandra increscens subsp. villosa]|uniref:Aluminum-activated malate transporter n=1 Tax=Deinandra increscens subsp. villosa TaxID=3103831 RepID=A0AAP0DCS0_9ASTR
MENVSSPSPSPSPSPSTVFFSKIKHAIVDFANNIKKIGADDPRRITHSFKVALAITLVSMVYYLQPFYKGIGDAGMWAILTVVVVFEYTVGATLSKGMNRGFATLLAGALGVGAESFGSLFGPTVKPVVIGFLVFFLVAAATFSRFIPNIKKRYDYGVLIFILTFSLVSVSGYRVEKIIQLAHQRLSTIIFGGFTCIIISMCVCPVWAGEDLHKNIVKNIEKLANFLEGFGDEYYRVSKGDKSFIASYKSVLNSKATEDSLANFAWWEIGHGKFRFRHPWKQYLKIGDYARKCAYHIETLNGYLDAKYEIPSEFQITVQEPCMKMSSELGKALKELAISMKLMVYPSTSFVHIENCKKTVDELNTTLKASMVAEWDILETIPVIAVTSILVDIIKCVEKLSEAIEELAKQARFKKPKDVIMDKTDKPHFHHRGAAIKPVDGEKDQELKSITVLCVDKLEEATDLFMVEIIHIRHKFNVEGIVLDHDSGHLDMNQRAENYHIFTCDVSLEYEKRVKRSNMERLVLACGGEAVYLMDDKSHKTHDCHRWAWLVYENVLWKKSATLSKGMNRGFATLLAGALGVGAESFGSLFGPTVKPVVIGFLVFFLVAAATFSRFIPNIKKRYDYGVLIFILTFSLVSVSGYRVEKIIQLAHQRLSTIIFGGFTCIIISMCVCPVWAGEDLHKNIVKNIEKLANFLEGFGDEYYRVSKGDKSFIASYKSVLNSKATEDSLANFAWWEIGHGKFRFRHPWKQYLKIGDYARKCAYHIETLNGYLDAKYEIPSEFQITVQEPCMKMSSELGKALKELAISMKLMVYPSTSFVHIENCKKTVDELNTTLKASMVAEWDILETIPVIAVTSILVDIIKCVEKLSEAIEELAKQARFKKPKDVIMDKTDKPHFHHRGAAIKPVDGEKDQELKSITVL